jgi:hypothetical protein
MTEQTTPRELTEEELGREMSRLTQTSISKLVLQNTILEERNAQLEAMLNQAHIEAGQAHAEAERLRTQLGDLKSDQRVNGKVEKVQP